MIMDSPTITKKYSAPTIRYVDSVGPKIENLVIQRGDAIAHWRAKRKIEVIHRKTLRKQVSKTSETHRATLDALQEEHETAVSGRAHAYEQAVHACNELFRLIYDYSSKGGEDVLHVLKALENHNLTVMYLSDKQFARRKILQTSRGLVDKPPGSKTPHYFNLWHSGIGDSVLQLCFLGRQPMRWVLALLIRRSPQRRTAVTDEQPQTDSTPPISEARRNYDIYMRKYRADLEKDHFGKTVLLHDGEVAHIFNSREDAYAIGCRDYGLGNFSMQEIGAKPSHIATPFAV